MIKTLRDYSIELNRGFLIANDVTPIVSCEENDKVELADKQTTKERQATQVMMSKIELERVQTRLFHSETASMRPNEWHWSKLMSLRCSRVTVVDSVLVIGDVFHSASMCELEEENVVDVAAMNLILNDCQS